jgi:FtsH-binding integral membrane protein
MGVSYTGTLVRTGAERATLVRRTYALVFASVILTAGSVVAAQQSPALMGTVIQHPIITVLVMFGSLIMAQRTAAPFNLGLVGLFTVLEGLFLAPYLAFAEQRTPGITAQAGLLTLSTFGILTAYATLSRRDFSAWGAFFVVGLWVLIGSMLLNMFFPSTLGSLWIAGGIVLVFSGLLVFDTWRITRSGQFGPDDYVPAALSIYLDLLNLFLGIVRLLGGNRR